MQLLLLIEDNKSYTNVALILKWARAQILQLIVRALFQDEKDGLLKFTEEALGIGEDEESRIQLNDKLNSTLDKMRYGFLSVLFSIKKAIKDCNS